MSAGDGSVAFDRARYRKAPFPEPQLALERRADGTLILSSPVPLAPPEVRCVSEYLPLWAAARAEVPMFCQRGADGAWRHLTYRDMWQTVRALGSALLALELPPGQPLMLLSGNSIEYAAMVLAADYAGVAIAPVSPAYSLLSSDFARLKGVCALVAPGAVFVQNATAFARALEVIGIPAARVIAVAAGSAAQLRYAELAATPVSAELEAAHARIAPETLARIYFTSGSTGVPKGVPTTHRMLTASQAMSFQLYQGDPARIPVYLDWLPWHHAFGGVANFNRVLRQGGSHYIDEGRPLPGQFQASVRNLRELALTSFANVPAAHALLAGELEHDAELARHFFDGLEALAYGGASLPHDVWERIQRVAVKTVGEKIVFLSGYAATETASVGTAFYWEADDTSNIGIPLPGCEVKLVPDAERHDRYELRMRGPHVFSGYLHRPDLTALAFDEEGYYRLGDAVRLADPNAPVKGMRFAGRTVEDFKLPSGTWVHTGTARLAAITLCSPLLRDAVVCGHEHEYVAVLAWPHEQACRALAPALAELPLAELVRHPVVTDALAQRLSQARGAGASLRIERVLLMAEPPSIDANEIADKGYVNQAATRARRAALVEELYREPAAAHIACARPASA